MLGGPAGEHGIMGIGDGFIPPLVDMREVDGVEAVSTAEAMATAQRIRREHGCCVGVSAGANLAAALRVRAGGARVATLWPDRGDRYVSVGLEGPDAPGIRCDLRACCEAGSRAMQGEHRRS
jgi:cysteine synthase A